MATIGELMIRAGIDIADVVTGAAAIGKELDGISAAVEKNFAGLDRMGARMQQMGAGLTAAITLPLVGIAAASLNLAAGFEAGMNKVQALGDITGQALKDLEAQAIDLGAKTKYSAKEAADGMGELAAAGLNATQIAAAMPAVLDLAAAGEMAVGAAAKVTADTMGQFGIAAENMGHAMDVISHAANASQANISEISVALKYVGPVAKAAGISFEDTAAAITILAKAGIQGSSAGTALRGIIASLENPSQKAQKALSDLGVSVKDAAGNLKPLNDILEQLKAAGISLDQVFKIVGREPAAAFQTLINMAPGLRQVATEMHNVDGETRRMADTLNSGLKGAFERAKGSIETLGIVIGKALEPVAIQLAAFVESAGNKLAEWATAFGKLPIGVQEAALAFAALAAAAGPVLIAVGAMAQGFVAISAAVVPFATAMSGLGLSAAGLGAELTTAQSAFVGFSAAVVGIAGIAVLVEQFGELRANIAGLATDFGSSEQGVIAFGDSFVKALSDITGVTTELNFLKTIFGGLGSAVEEYLVSITKAGKYTTDFGAAAGGTAKQFSTLELAWSDFKTAISGNWVSLIAGPIGALNEGLKALRETLSLVTGKFTDMDAAVKKTAAGLQANVTAHDKISEAALKTAAAQRNVVTSFDAANAATAKVASGLNAAGDAHDKNAKKAEDSARRAAVAYERAGEQIKKALENLAPDSATEKVQKQIDLMVSSLDTLFKAYQAGRISLDQYSDATGNFSERLRNLDVEIGVAAGKAATALAKSFSDALETIHQKALEPIDVHWELAEGDAGENIARLQRVAQAIQPIEINWKLPDELISSLDDARAKVVAIDDAMKLLGIDNGQAASKAKALADAYDVVAEAAAHGMATQRQADEAQSKAIEAHIAEMKILGQSYDDMGVSVEENQKNLDGLKDKLAGVSKAAKEQVVEVENLGDKWDSFSDHVSNSVSKLGTTLVENLMKGTLNFKSVWNSFLSDISKSFTDIFIKPVTDAIGEFISGALKSLIGGQGFGGVATAAKDAAKTIKDAFGAGTDAASSAAGAAGGASGGGGISSAASGIGSLSSILSIVGIGVSAASGIVSGVQQAHANSLLDKIEKSTREVSVVTWQTGAESLQGLLKDIRNISLQMRDRLVDLRDAIFSPLAIAMEAIDNTLKTLILPALGGVRTDVQDGTQQTTTQSDENTQSLADQIQAGIDANLAQANEALAVANGIAGAANLTAEEIAGLQALSERTAAATTATADATTNLAGTVTQSGGEIINALGQTGSEIVQAQLTSTDAMLAQLAALGSDIDVITGNAYTDLKATIKGVSSQSLADQAAAIARAAAQAAAAAKIGMSPLELGGFVNYAPVIPQAIDPSKQYYGGPTQFQGLGNALTVNTPTLPNLTGVAQFGGVSDLPITPPGGFYVPPNPYTSAPSAGFRQGGNALVGAGSYTPQRNAINVNIYGNVTGYDEAQKMMSNAAENITRAIR